MWGFDRKQISDIKEQHSRARTINEHYQQCLLLEHEIGVLNLHDDSSEDENLVKAQRNHRQPQKEEEEKSPAIE